MDSSDGLMHWYVKAKKEARCMTQSGREMASVGQSLDKDTGFVVFSFPDGHEWLSDVPALGVIEDKVAKKPSCKIFWSALTHLV